MSKFFRPPPADVDDFFELLDLIWTQGIGNTSTPDGLCGQEWKNETLIAAFEAAKGSISESTIQKWRGRIVLPQTKNLYTLVSVVSNRETRPAWRDALYTSVRRTRRARNGHAAANRNDETDPNVVAALARPSPAAAAQEEGAPAGPASGRFNVFRTGTWARSPVWILPGLAAAVLLAFVSGALLLQRPYIADLRVCDVEHFSVANQACSRHMDRFPPDIKRVYVSFDIQNFPDNKPFTRAWYLNGQKILERKGLTAPPWEGWTWHGNKNPDAPDAVPATPGNYTLRIQAGPTVRSVAFKVGTGDRLSPGQRFQDPLFDGKDDAPEMVVLPEGSFVKGAPGWVPGRRPDEGPHHTVTIGYQMAISAHEVTWDEWMKCVDDGGCGGYVPAGRDQFPGNAPVVNVSYDDIFAYIQWLNGRLRIAQERFDRYTLPTESEWEFAALAGVQGTDLQSYAFGHALTTEQARFGDRSETAGPVAAGSYPANGWGISDMHGNVAEWVEDCYRPDHDDTLSDGRAFLEADCSRRVIKGGSFADSADLLRVPARRSELPGSRHPDVGFRIVRRLEERPARD